MSLSASNSRLFLTNFPYISTTMPRTLNNQHPYPFGLMMSGRSWSEGYRFGFQNQEEDNDADGIGKSINFKYRDYDPRIGRMKSIDPLAQNYPFYSPYTFSGNRVIDRVELEGLEPANPPYLWKISEIEEFSYGTMMRADGFHVFQDYDNHGDIRYRWYDEGSSTWSSFNPTNPNCTSCGIHSIMTQGWDATKKYASPTLQIMGGIIAVAAAIPSGGTSLGVYGALATSFGVTTGLYSTVNGMATLTLLADGNDAVIDEIPDGFLNATVGLSITYLEGEQEIDKYIAATLSIVEGVISISSPNPDDLQTLDKAINVVMTTVSVTNTLSDD